MFIIESIIPETKEFNESFNTIDEVLAKYELNENEVKGLRDCLTEKIDSYDWFTARFIDSKESKELITKPTGPVLKCIMFEGSKIFILEDADKVYIELKSTIKGIKIKDNQIPNQIRSVKASNKLKNFCKDYNVNNQNSTFLEIELIPTWMDYIRVTHSMKADDSNLVSRIANFKATLLETIKASLKIETIPEVVEETIPEESNTLQKLVDFEGDQIFTIQDMRTGIIYAGIKSICKGIGFSENQITNQVSKVKDDIVLGKYQEKFLGPTGTNNVIQEISCIEVTKIPLWLAKINITPAIRTENPTLSRKLEFYQEKAGEVLASAFLPQMVKTEGIKTPTISHLEALKMLSVAVNENIFLIEANQKLVSKNVELVTENVQQQYLIEDMKAPVNEHKIFMDTSNSLSIGEFAKLVRATPSGSNVPIGRTNMFKFLKDIGMLNKDKSPSQYYINLKYFETKSIILTTGETYQQSRLTKRGAQYTVYRLKKSGYSILAEMPI